MLNCTIATGVLVRKQGAGVIVLSMLAMVEYIHLVFSFPIEQFHFHKCAMNYRDKQYSQFLRDTYIQRFGLDNPKAQLYQQINQRAE